MILLCLSLFFSLGHAATMGNGSATIPAGTVLFQERFETAVSSPPWYDGSGGIVSNEHIPGSTHSYECRFSAGATTCASPRRREVSPATDRVYLSFHIKHSSSWVGSGRPYHPHMFHFITNQDSNYVGPARTHLTTYIEAVGGRPMLALQDSLNVDLACVLLNNDSSVGCNGNYSTYSFSESRSVCSCNGLVGDLDGRDCFSIGGGGYYSSRGWNADQVYFRDEAGAYNKTDWHFIEAYFELNTISGGVGVPDGKIRFWYDGELLLSYDRILFRTAEHPTMLFDQFLITPYIGDGSPVTQSFFIDDLTVSTGPPTARPGVGGDNTPPAGPANLRVVP